MWFEDTLQSYINDNVEELDEIDVYVVRQMEGKKRGDVVTEKESILILLDLYGCYEDRFNNKIGQKEEKKEETEEEKKEDVIYDEQSKKDETVGKIVDKVKEGLDFKKEQEALIEQQKAEQKELEEKQKAEQKRLE